jgi:hypothetical protein
VQIDTLYCGTMLIYSTSVEKLGLSEQQNAAKKRLFPFTDGGVEMVEATAVAESFGMKELKKDVAVYFATPKVLRIECFQRTNRVKRRSRSTN